MSTASTPDFTHIAWTDLETTGLFPDNDHLLEVGIVLTDLELNVIDERAWVVVPRTLDLMRMNWKVREMHTANGLLADVLAKSESWVPGGGALSAGDVDFEIVGWLRGHDAQNLGLGGSGVSHFDVRWINKHLHEFARTLHRSTLDVGVIRRFIENVAGVPEMVPQVNRDLNHRALDDAHNHLAEARVYRGFFRKNGRLPWHRAANAPPLGRGL